MTTNVYWGSFHHDNWRFYLAATDLGLCYIGSPNHSFVEVEKWISKKINKPVLLENDIKLTSTVETLKQYLNGEEKECHIPLDPIGTTFQKDVWNASMKIPYGETRTYQQIAEMIQRPKAVRAVGSAIGANPLLMIIPCHRIIAKNGGLSGFRAGLDMKRFLLELEYQMEHL